MLKAQYKDLLKSSRGNTNISKKSKYLVRLRSKQCLRKFYGNLSNRTLSLVYIKASRLTGDVGQNLCVSIERRLDVCLFRMNLLPTIFSSRQALAHGRVSVNGAIVSTPNLLVGESAIVCVHAWQDYNGLWQRSLNPKKLFRRALTRPGYVEVNLKILCGVFVYVPKKFEV